MPNTETPSAEEIDQNSVVEESVEEVYEEAKTRVGPFAKAAVGALVSAALAFLSSIATALSGDAATFADITDGQWVTAIVAALGALPIAGGTVYAVRNKPAPGSHTVAGDDYLA